MRRLIANILQARIAPAWFLFFFAPITAEYLSGSSTPFNPIILAANLILYGCGTLLIRELKIRWHKGWLAVFILSIAYCIAEEGLMLNTLFDPTKNTVGRLLGVNWVWTTGMFIVHSWISIFLPILFVEAAYPEKVKEPWLKPRYFFLILILFLANIFGLGQAFAPKNRPSLIYYAIETGIIIACLIAAYLAPSPANARPAGPARSARWLYFAALFGTLATFAASLITPSLAIPFLLKIAIMLAVYGSFLFFLNRRQVFAPSLSFYRQFVFACGIISFWLFVSPLASVIKHDPVPIMAAVLMIILLWGVRKKLEANEEKTRD